MSGSLLERRSGTMDGELGDGGSTGSSTFCFSFTLSKNSLCMA